MKSMIRSCIGVLVIAIIAVGPAVAAEYIDIDQPAGQNSVSFDSSEQQTFMPNAYNITAVSLLIQNADARAFTVQILDGLCGDVLAHGSAAGTGWVKCDLVGAQALTPGNLYTINVIPDGSIALVFSLDDPYTNGDRWNNCTNHRVGMDLAFRTWTDEEAVPTEKSTWGAIKSLYR